MRNLHSYKDSNYSKGYRNLVQRKHFAGVVQEITVSLWRGWIVAIARKHRDREQRSSGGGGW